MSTTFRQFLIYIICGIIALQEIFGTTKMVFLLRKDISFFTTEYFFLPIRITGRRMRKLKHFVWMISLKAFVIGLFFCISNHSYAGAFYRKSLARGAEGEYIMAQVEKIKGILLAAYPDCTVKVLTDSWYRGDGPDGYQDECRSHK